MSERESGRGGSGRTVYFFLHVPKCAGSTIIEHLEGHLGARALHAPRSAGTGRNFFGNRYPFAIDDPRLRDVDLIYGHALSASLRGLLPRTRILETALLRDPVGWFVSMYNFRLARERDGVGSRVPPFADWYQAERRNPIARFLLYRHLEVGVPWLYGLSSADQLRRIEAALERFWFVGSYRAVGKLTDRIASDLGVPGSPEPRNVDSVRAVTVNALPDAQRRRIEAENRIDSLLYERWKDRGFDEGANPPPLGAELPRADQPALLLREAMSGARKLWLRHARGFRRPVGVAMWQRG